ncbi:MAG: hypothetical protein KF845_08790 [Cyclobacteriaceae bacterium]|nr:hypothetical protein [Cyclobacteriaceae bacterium]
MENKNQPLDPRQSLDLIASMISQAQGNMSSSSFYFLLWGWVIAFCNFGMYYFHKFTNYAAYAHYVWLLGIPASIITVIYSMRQEKSKGAITHLDKIMMWLWIGMMISIFPTWMFGDKINWMVNAIVLMPIGTATFVSGIVLRFKPLLVGGIIFWISGVLCYIVSPLDQFIVGGVAMILGYLVPGYMLRNKKQ